MANWFNDEELGLISVEAAKYDIIFYGNARDLQHHFHKMNARGDVAYVQMSPNINSEDLINLIPRINKMLNAKMAELELKP